MTIQKQKFKNLRNLQLTLDNILTITKSNITLLIF